MFVVSREKHKLFLKKVQSFRNKFANIFNSGMPSFWDDKGNLISQEYYQALLIQKKSEEDKFEYLDKHMKGSTIRHLILKSPALVIILLFFRLIITTHENETPQYPLLISFQTL